MIPNIMTYIYGTHLGDAKVSLKGTEQLIGIMYRMFCILNYYYIRVLEVVDA